MSLLINVRNKDGYLERESNKIDNMFYQRVEVTQEQAWKMNRRKRKKKV